MLTDKDRMIVDHVEKFGFVTISQAKDMYFNKTAYGYDMARKRLNKLVDSDYFKVTRNHDTTEKIFYMGNYRKISLHSMLLMNYYAKLLNSGVKMLHFEKEKEWMDGRIRSDAFAIFELGEYTFFQLIEVNVSHNTLNLEKYMDLFSAGEPQKLCKGYFPTLILVDDVEHKKQVELDWVKIIKLDFELNEFSKVFV